VVSANTYLFGVLLASKEDTSWLPIQGFVTCTHECTWKFRRPIYPNIAKESNQRCKRVLTRNLRTQQIGAQIVQANRQKSSQQMNTKCFRERLTQHSTSLLSSAFKKKSSKLISAHNAFLKIERPIYPDMKEPPNRSVKLTAINHCNTSPHNQVTVNAEKLQKRGKP
jgi:hypothetical protein